MNMPKDDDALEAALRRGLRARPEAVLAQGSAALAARAVALGIAQERDQARQLAQWLARRRGFNIAAAAVAAVLLGGVVALGGSRLSSVVTSISAASESSTASTQTTSVGTDTQAATTSQSQGTMLLLAGLGIVAVSAWGIERAMAGGASTFGGLEVPSLR